MTVSLINIGMGPKQILVPTWTDCFPPGGGPFGGRGQEMPHTKEKQNQEVIIASVTRLVIDAFTPTDKRDIWPRYMKLDTCAVYLDKAESTIRQWIAEGVLPAVELSTLQGREKLPVFVDRYALDALFAPRGEGS